MWEKWNDFLVVLSNLTQSDIKEATDFKAWLQDWANYVLNDAATLADRPPVKPPHP